MEVAVPCQYLGWDSDFFGRRIARVTEGRLSHGMIEAVMNWCSLQDIDCLYLLADAGDKDTIRLAEDNGFRLVDVRITLEKQFDTAPTRENTVSQAAIRPCLVEDIPTLRAIARCSYQDSRFYHDANFPVSLVDSLYETWIEKSYSGYADAVLVAQIHGQPVGYVSCHLLDQTSGQIGLIGVSMDYRGMGLGGELIHASLRWFAERAVTRTIVVTQGRNVQAQRLYQRCGFLTRDVQLWYHRWFLPVGARA